MLGEGEFVTGELRLIPPSAPHIPTISQASQAWGGPQMPRRRLEAGQRNQRSRGSGGQQGNAELETECGESRREVRKHSGEKTYKDI